MGRMIDATIQVFPILDYIVERKDTFIKVLQKNDNDYLFALLMDYFDSQPTAYDSDKVLKQLEDRSTLARPVGWTKSYEIITLVDAIEIVKGGGVDELEK